MINDLIKYLEGKKVLILGFGMEGYSTYRLIRRHLPEQKVYISDANSKVYEKYEDVQKDVNADIIPTDEYLKELEKYDENTRTFF